MDVRMCRLADNKPFWLAVCIVAAAAAVRAQSGGMQAPGAVQKQAWPPGVLSEVQVLLREGVPIALVLGLNDRVEAPPPSGPAAPQNHVAVPGESAALGEFRLRWAAAYTITQTNDVLTVASQRTPLCRAGLARTVLPQAYSGTPLEILFGIASAFDESLRKLPPPGMVHGGGAGMTEEARDTIARPISISVEGGSLQHALNLFVTSAPGLGWLAWERCDAGKCGCYLSLVTGTSVLWTSYDASAGLRLEPRDRDE